MSKVKIVIITIIAVVGALLIYEYTKVPQMKKVNNNFSHEYTLVDKNNVFTYNSFEEINKFMKDGYAVIYLGFPECEWCQYYTKYLNEVALEKEVGLINYYNFKSIRDNHTQNYKTLTTHLSNYLETDDEGQYRLNAPALVVIKAGKIVAFDDETSNMSKNNSPEDYWNEEKINEFKNKIGTYFEEYIGINKDNIEQIGGI